MHFDPVCLRVLGALVEKEVTTPDAYPLSLNSLLNAANQRSSRDPVSDYAEEEVRSALDTLISQEFVNLARDGSRVPRFEHRMRTVLNLRRDETAILCLLLLRGAQTPGELRSRADRLFRFEDLESVQTTLDRLASRQTAIVRALQRTPGSREVRWVHLLGAPLPKAVQTGEIPSRDAELGDQIDQLEERIRLIEERLRFIESQGIAASSIQASTAHDALVR